MFTVAVLAFDGVFASALTGVVDLLNLTGVTWNRIHGQPLDQQFKAITICFIWGCFRSRLLWGGGQRTFDGEFVALRYKRVP